MSLAFMLFALVVSSISSYITCVIGVVGAIGISMTFPPIRGRGRAKRGPKTTVACYGPFNSGLLVAGRGRSEVSIPMRLMIAPMVIPILFVTGDANHPHNTHTDNPEKMLIATFRDSVSQLF